jgi:pimeloyl-ACP methyl ester carboxylesterase
MHDNMPTRRAFTYNGHTTSYLDAGPSDGPLMIFVHGWPELAISWRHQLPCFAALGFRAVALDMRGYGASTAYAEHSAYAQRHATRDLINLIDHLATDRAIWVGHDWGCCSVWNVARHHPGRCLAIANLCVPYRTLDLGLDACIELVDRDLYPVDKYPAGQWEYQLFYAEQFDRATKAFESDPYNVVKLLFRKGNPDGVGQVSGTAMTRINNGWFGDAQAVPDLPRDDDVVSAADLAIYANALSINGFFGPDSYYVNHEDNARYAAETPDDDLHMPVLFLGARYDYTCETVVSRACEPMRAACRHLTQATVDSGHWMPQERPVEVNQHIVRWLVNEVPGAWPP